MFSRPRLIFIFIVLILTTAGATAFWSRGESKEENTIGSPWIGSLFVYDAEHVVSRKIKKGDVFANVAGSFGLRGGEANAVLEIAKGTYDLSRIVEGREISFIFDKETGALKRIVYQIDSEEVIAATKNASGWTAERTLIPYAVEREEISGAIHSSLFETIVESGGDERVALALAEVFAWQIDFGADIREGDQFKLLYEKRFINNNYAGPGKIVAAKFINDGKVFKGIYFAPPAGGQGEEGYYDEEGASLHKIFLKSPLSYKYISSAFSYGRLNPVTRSEWGPHRAIDYAADYGTPVVTVGEGTATYAGWKGELGNIVQVRHNDTYTTVYAHLSRFAVRTGAKVTQGQIIGYVGATGQATGPHLHFEMYKNGGYVNPLTIELPPGEPIQEADRPAFESMLAEHRNFLDS